MRPEITTTMLKKAIRHRLVHDQAFAEWANSTFGFIFNSFHVRVRRKGTAVKYWHSVMDHIVKTGKVLKSLNMSGFDPTRTKIEEMQLYIADHPELFKHKDHVVAESKVLSELV